jgi:response regulator NasT
MRVLLVGDKSGPDAGTFEALLRQLEECPGSTLRLLGSAPFQSDTAQEIRQLLPDMLDLVIIKERAWPDHSCAQEILNLGLGIVIVTAPERVERFRGLAEEHTISFLPPDVEIDALWSALESAWAAHRRETQLKQQLAHLQQRLEDRIVIERAKGILVQRLKISEEDAYQRLRVLSRRQRRQIRDIAQSLLDTQCLFSSEVNGFARQETEGVSLELENEVPEELGP